MVEAESLPFTIHKEPLDENGVRQRVESYGIARGLSFELTQIQNITAFGKTVEKEIILAIDEKSVILPWTQDH